MPAPAPLQRGRAGLSICGVSCISQITPWSIPCTQRGSIVWKQRAPYCQGWFLGPHAIFRCMCVTYVVGGTRDAVKAGATHLTVAIRNLGATLCA